MLIEQIDHLIPVQVHDDVIADGRYTIKVPAIPVQGLLGAYGVGESTRFGASDLRVSSG